MAKDGAHDVGHAEVSTAPPGPQKTPERRSTASVDAKLAKDDRMQKFGWRSMRLAKSNLVGPTPEKQRKYAEKK